MNVISKGNKATSARFASTALLSRQGGFTLPELLAVMAIIGTLSVVAVPAYQDYVIRGKIVDAVSNLALKRVDMEQCFQDNHSYAAAPCRSICTESSGLSRYFDFACLTEPAATTFEITAIGKDSMAGFAFSIDQSNAKTTVAVPDGWDKPAPNNCWVTKRGGAC